MSGDFLPKSDAELQAWVINFLTVANANLTQLGILASDLTFLTAASGNFTTQLASVNATKKTLKMQVATKDLTHKTISNGARALARRIQGNGAVAGPLKEQLGLNPHTSKPGYVTPVTPTQLTVTGADNGVNSLQWNRSGNHSSTVFLVEAQLGNGPFVQVGAPTATKFLHTGQTPGIEITYRIRARRRTILSEPSNTATLYKTGATTAAQTPVLELKKPPDSRIDRIFRIDRIKNGLNPRISRRHTNYIRPQTVLCLFVFVFNLVHPENPVNPVHSP